MESPLRFETPEQIDIEYDVARLGSRFIAGLWDHTILSVVMILISVAFYRLATVGVVPDNLMSILLAALLILYFVIYWGYFVLFETIWDGQTPGKRLVSLRTIRRDGYPIGLAQSTIRNLVRFIDMFPGSYGVGIVVMFGDRLARRLGDFAAGTIVVHDRRGEGIGQLRAFTARPPTPATDSLGVLSEIRQGEIEVARRFLQRRNQLETSTPLASSLAGPLRDRLGPQVQALNDVALLQQVVAEAGSGGRRPDATTRLE